VATQRRGDRTEALADWPRGWPPADRRRAATGAGAQPTCRPPFCAMALFTTELYEPPPSGAAASGPRAWSGGSGGSLRGARVPRHYGPGTKALDGAPLSAPLATCGDAPIGLNSNSVPAQLLRRHPGAPMPSPAAHPDAPGSFPPQGQPGAGGGAPQALAGATPHAPSAPPI